MQTHVDPQGNFTINVIFPFPSYFHSDSANSELLLGSRQLQRCTRNLSRQEMAESFISIFWGPLVQVGGSLRKQSVMGYQLCV